MAGLIAVLDGGPASTLQDEGRPGHRAQGVPLSGALDPLWLACANHLVGNDAAAAAIEMRGLGPRLEVGEGPLRLALVGPVAGRIERADGRSEPCAPWRSWTLDAGDRLIVGPVGGGVAYLALAGGIDAPPHLGSRSTYARARLGGINGRGLKAGDRLNLGRAEPGSERQAPPFKHDNGPLRVLLGPQDDHFTEAALADFLSVEFTATREMDRMGMRLSGPRLVHRPDRGAEMISDGVTPGAVQVPADGQPIVLLADGQTVGGYPKIATVIAADRPRLAHVLPGQSLTFLAVDRAAARAAWRRQQECMAEWRERLAPADASPGLDEAALIGANLISGVVDMAGEDS